MSPDRMTLRQLEQAATPAPWHHDYWHGSKPLRWLIATEDERPIIVDTVDTGEADAALIAALRNAAPLLLDVVDAARATKAAHDEALLHPVVANAKAYAEAEEAMFRALGALDAAT